MVNVFSETEERIFQAALEEFALHGRSGARLQNVADRANINKALVHYYFRNKDTLYERIFEYIVQRYLSTVGESIADSTDFRSMLETFIGRFIDLIDHNPGVFRVMLHEILSGAPVLRSRFPDILGSTPHNPVALLLGKLHEARGRHAIRDVDPMQTLVSLFGCCIYTFLGFPLIAAMDPSLEERRAQFIEERKRHVFDILYLGLLPRPEAVS
jgi:TetR/AcrR family transcriptional regulator